MTVPATILALLQQSDHVSYAIAEKPAINSHVQLVHHDNNACLVKGIILRDSQGQLVQVLVSDNSFVNIDAMFRSFDKRFEGIATHEIFQLLKTHELLSVPAIPSWQGMTCYVDDTLLKQDLLLLDAGDRKSIVKLNNENFRALIDDSKVAAFTANSKKVTTQTKNDEQLITRSLERFTELRIRQRLDETLELPPLPETAQRIIKLRADPNADISDLTNIVEIDPSLAAQVVSWAASPYYSAPGKIKSVHDAIVRVLGFDMVLNLALGLSLGKTLTMKSLSKSELENYWQGAVYTAAAVEGLVTSIAREHRPSFGMAYLSGLLNNFGFLVIAEIFPPYAKLLRSARSANAHLLPAIVENSLLGVSGNQIASWLFENWNMPEEVIAALRQQSDPEYSGDHFIYARLNYVAKQMLANRGIGNILPADVPDELFESLHLDKANATLTLDNILEAGDDLDAIAEKMRG